MNWTPQQRDAITTTGRSLLVSAAAGSGKTAVLAERCAYLVCDAPERADVDELLVVTFTNAAAAEMRGRIESALRKRLEKTANDQRLNKQIRLLGRAQINTIHGFCTRFLKRHFDVLGFDPNFRILDEQEVELLRHDTARELFDSRYETDTAGQFQRFVDLYGDGDDQSVLRRVLNLHDLMGSIVDPDRWLDDAARRVEEARNCPRLKECALGQELAQTCGNWLDGLRRRWVQLAEQIRDVPGLEAYGEYVNDMVAAVECWRAALGDGNFDKLAKEIADFEAGRLTTFRDPPPEKEIFQARINAIRKEMREGPITSLCRFTEQQWRDGLAATDAHVRTFVQLVRDFAQRFDQAKRALRGMDFSDLERFTLKILHAPDKGDELIPSAIARSYHSQFKHVLVDEYQDINEVQDAILRLLSRESVLGETDLAMNLFCVGDIKQSIYRFRLAQPRRFLQRYELFKAKQPAAARVKPAAAAGLFGEVEDKTPARSRGPAGQNIDLSSNFRARAPLLNVLNAVFERLMTRQAAEIEYDRSQRLMPAAKFPAGEKGKTFNGSPVELHLLPTPPRGGNDHTDTAQTEEELDRTEREAAFVAMRIKELLSSGMQVADKTPDGTAILRPIKCRDIVILLRALRFKGEQFAQALRAEGIPVHTDSRTGLFESMEIRDMLALLRVLDNQQQDIPLAAVLRSPLSGLPEPEDCLARIRLAYPDAASAPFHQAVTLYAAEHQDDLAAHLRPFLETLADWRRQARQKPLAELLWHIYDTTGYLAFCSGMADGPQRVANLISFHERARQFGSFQRQGLSRFMEFLESLEEHSDLGTPSIASQADDVVQIMSVHRSKGLEFPVVILPELGKRHNIQDSTGLLLLDRESGIGLMVADEEKRIRYPSLAHALVQERIRRQSLAEELRVLYVAMTRAKEHLILVSTVDESMPQQWRDEWTRFAGPFPPERILSARSMLDWIGPAAAAIEGTGDADRIRIIWHNEEEIAKWEPAISRRPTLSDAQLRLARLQPLDAPPTVHPDAKRIMDRLGFEYPHQRWTTVAAAQSVGSLAKQEFGVASPAGRSRPPDELPAPRCTLAEKVLSPTEIGSATHQVLEHMDFSRLCDPDDIRRQVADQVEKKLLIGELAGSVDVESIVWLLSTPLGEMLRRNATKLIRELPIYYPMISQGNPPSTDPLDRVMVRGRIDLLVPDKDGLIVVDFKTDQVTSQTVDARAESYRPQVAAYRDAIVKITRQAVKSAMLVFLAARVIREI